MKNNDNIWINEYEVDVIESDKDNTSYWLYNINRVRWFWKLSLANIFFCGLLVTLGIVLFFTWFINGILITRQIYEKIFNYAEHYVIWIILSLIIITTIFRTLLVRKIPLLLEDVESLVFCTIIIIFLPLFELSIWAAGKESEYKRLKHLEKISKI
ncbi:hypothetical protein KQ876_00865 [Mycoplasma sp. CSL7491-lung]|uniref:hypothetical protein n=1 Tax=Mycoplasma sp. CSL7491-lung TaxID=549718 RepID=UPI001C121FDA|nr:hypothetical protein [Mycoplasma sp. CSL7491-lung]MBU4692757.1 hypothetical protein [Mycoplasma sp. CSL7491-lung]